MNEITIRPVRTQRERRIFLTFPWKIYRDDPLWVPPLLPERSKTIDPAQGPFFKRGTADIFIAWKNGSPVGTICAAEDPNANIRRGKKECVFGFFEAIQNYEVAEALLNKAEEWGKARGLTTLYGPFNLDYEDAYGILVEGRDRPPAILCGHTPPYYVDFVERYGLEPARAHNVALAVNIDKETPQLKRLSRIAEKVRKRRQFIIREGNFDRWDEEVDKVLHLLNTATAHLDDHIGWERDVLASLLEPFKKIADPNLILFADVEDKTVGFFPGIPNLNEAFIHTNGLRYPWDYLKLLWHVRKKPECLSIKSVLVLPEYWNKGIAVLLFDEMAKRARKQGYSWVDLSITAADNPNTIILAEHMGAWIYKRWQVYRKDFF